MNTDHYKQRLLAQEQELVTRIAQGLANARERDNESATDVGDQSVTSARTDEQLTEAAADSTLLGQVRDALTRIEGGTFGRCLIDGEPIEQKRLDAAPWSEYCLQHQEERESDTTRRATM